MPDSLFTYALFLIPLFFIGAGVLIGLPIAMSLQDYYKNRGRQSVTCPGSGEAASVTVDRKFAFRMALRGQEHSRLESCSNWPLPQRANTGRVGGPESEKSDCGQECLAQLEASPENVERLLTKWYEGKSCAICARSLTPADWQRSRLAVLNRDQKLIELRELTLEGLPSLLQEMRPLCWNCHQEERVRQAVPPRILKGDRHGLATLEEPV